MPQRVRKAVLPVAGLGTRFLPATKAMPKEMLTVVDRPLIQYAVEECLAAGIEEFVFVTGRNKSAIEDHFDAAYELEATLHERGKKSELKQTQDAAIKPGNAIFTRQQRPLGLGHAVWCARDWIGREPFAVLLPDELTIDSPSCTAQLVAAHDKTGPALMLSFVVAGLACVFAALCYAEFASMVPVAGSAYTYAYASFGELIAWIIGWDLLLEYAIGNIAIAISWSDYFTALLSGFGVNTPPWMTMDFLTALRGHNAVNALLGKGQTVSEVLAGHP